MNYLITCYADFLGYAIALFKVEKTVISLLKIEYNKIVSNKDIQVKIQTFINELAKQRISRNNILIEINDNKALFKYLKAKLDYFRYIHIFENLDIEQSLYCLSVAINEEQFLISKDLVKENLVGEIRTIDLNVVNHKVYSLLLGIETYQKQNRMFQVCMTTGQTIMYSDKVKHPFGKYTMKDARNIRF